MNFINDRNKKQLFLAGPLVVVVAASTITGCSSGGTAAPAQGSVPGQWTKAQVSQLTAAVGSTGTSCEITYIERDMSFGNAMALNSVDPASSGTLSSAQIDAALVSKYGAAEGAAINAQYERFIADAGNNCSASATAPAATAPAATAPTDPAATSESSCSVDCQNPVATDGSEWLAQVQPALQNLQQALNSISSDSTSMPEELTMDGADLEGAAQAALDPNIDPPPADNTDWTTAMNDYVTAGEDYTSDNMNTQDDNPTAAGQQVTAGNTALASFNAANDGILNGIIQSS